MSVAENKALVYRTVDAFNRGDLAAVDTLFAADYLDHDRSRAALPPGPAGVKLAWGAIRAAFPDLRATIEDVVAEGDKVAVRGTIRGTHRGELMGIPPTGRAVAVSLIDVNRIAGGRLVERWAEIDALGLMQQVGVLPGPGAAAGAAESPSPAASTPEPTSEAELLANKATVRRFFAEVSRGDLEAALDLHAPTLVAHLAGAPAPLDHAAFRQFGEMFHAAFGDERIVVEDQIAEGDKVVSRVAETATHVGDFQGIPVTGRQVTMTGMWLDRVAGGRIVERWSIFDALGLLRQLGAIAP